MKSSPFIALAVACAFCGPAAAQTRPGGTPATAEPVPKDSVSQYGVTWTFDRPVPVGRFVTGDFYVVGPVTVVKIEPAPEGTGAALRNGSMLNPPTDVSVAYDGRIRGHRDELVSRAPLALKPGDSLVSAISLEKVQQNQVLPNPSRSTETSLLKTAAILTCLAAPVPADAFRPSYGDLKKDRIRLARDIQWDKLPSVPAVGARRLEGVAGEALKDVFTAEGLPAWEWVERMFERPWLDHVYSWHSRELHPSENLPGYGREIGRAVSYAALLASLDVPRERKETLVRRLIQVGIDNWGVATRSKKGSAGGWVAQGGFGNGRKLPIVFAALLLNDPEMLEIRRHAGEASFGEDEHTEMGPSWTGATVRFRGQYPLIGDRQIDRGPYEHLPPSEWPGRNKTMSEGYRRCCTSVSWVGQALVMRMMKAEPVWDHDAFFAYVDRWMYEDDTAAIEEIRKAHPGFGGARQGSTLFDPWIEAMWRQYRMAPGMPPIDGWKTQP